MPDEVDPKNNPDASVVSNANNVGHADVVTNAESTDVAAVVGHAEKVGTVEIHGEPIRSDRTRRLSYIREIARNAVTFFALLVMIVVIFDKNANENSLEDQLKDFRSERAISDAATAKKLECVRRYTDAIDIETERQLILIGEFLVVITQTPPGQERTDAVKIKIDELDRTNIAARAAMAAKIEYNNQGNPLPCPIGPSEAPPVPPPPDAGVAVTVATTPTT